MIGNYVTLKHAAGECRRMVKNLTNFVKYFKSFEIYDHMKYIEIHDHVKYIEIHDHVKYIEIHDHMKYIEIHDHMKYIEIHDHMKYIEIHDHVKYIETRMIEISTNMPVNGSLDLDIAVQIYRHFEKAITILLSKTNARILSVNMNCLSSWIDLCLTEHPGRM